MYIISIIFIIVAVAALCWTFYKIKHIKKVDKETEKINEEIKQENENLLLNNNQLRARQTELTTNNYILEKEKNNLLQENERIKHLNDDKESILIKGLENYGEILETKYQEVENEYIKLIQVLEKSYNNHQDLLIKENEKQAAALKVVLDQLKEEIAELRATKQAAMEAYLREEEVKKHKEFHSVQPTDSDFEDIRLLEKIIPDLKNPRAILKVIWSEYYQKATQEMCKRILKTTSKVCGIYKIKNQINGLCYVGQSKDIDERWKTHMKCGLGVETETKGKKLHEAMKQYGVHNFTFEILEICSENKLNEKEKFYIDIEQAFTCGYNLTKGNN